MINEPFRATLEPGLRGRRETGGAYHSPHEICHVLGGEGAKFWQCCGVLRCWGGKEQVGSWDAAAEREIHAAV